jgi:hypothetical protein
MYIFFDNTIPKASTHKIQGSSSILSAQRPIWNYVNRYARSHPSTSQHPISNYILPHHWNEQKPCIANCLPPVQFSISIQRKLRLPILPYPCQCQCSKICDEYGDHPFHCPKNHKCRSHNMIVDRFSPALAKLLTTANIISPTSTLMVTILFIVQRITKANQIIW